MTDRTQFEAMLEALINEDQETAKEIFHNIVVAKSREIYESLLESEEGEEEEGMEEGAEEEEESVEEEGMEEGADEEEEEEGEEEEGGDDVGGDATDDMIGDLDGEEGDEEGSDGDMEDRVMDLEDALDELKAEFEQLMAGEEGEEHMGGMDDMGGDEFGDEAGLDQMMEYVNKVSPPKHGDNGTNTKSIVAGKNDMGGTSANIAKSFSTEKGGTEGGLLKPSTQLQDGGNMNKPGAKAGKTAFKKTQPGHGAEKKGASEQADNKRSIVGSRK